MIKDYGIYVPVPQMGTINILNKTYVTLSVCKIYVLYIVSNVP